MKEIECPLCEGEGGIARLNDWISCEQCKGKGKLLLHDSGVYANGFPVKCRGGFEYPPGYNFSENEEEEEA